MEDDGIQDILALIITDAIETYLLQKFLTTLWYIWKAQMIVGLLGKPRTLPRCTMLFVPIYHNNLGNLCRGQTGQC